MESHRRKLQKKNEGKRREQNTLHIGLNKTRNYKDTRVEVHSDGKKEEEYDEWDHKSYLDF